MCFGLKGVSILAHLDFSSPSREIVWQVKVREEEDRREKKRGHTDSLLYGLFGIIGSLLALFDTRSKGFSDLLVELDSFSTDTPDFD